MICTNILLAQQEDTLPSFFVKLDNLEKDGKVDVAINLCEKHLSSNRLQEDDIYKVTLRLAILYNNYSCNRKRAIELLKEVIAKYPNNENKINALFTLGHIYFQYGEGDVAMSIFKEIIEKYPNSKYASIAKSELEIIRNKELSKSIQEGTKQLDFVNNLNPFMGYCYVIYQIFKNSILRFIIIFLAIIVLKKGKVKMLKKEILWLGSVVSFIPTVSFLIYLFPFVSRGHFLLYEKYIDFIVLRPIQYYYILAIGYLVMIVNLLIYLSLKKIRVKSLIFSEMKVYKNILLSIPLSLLIFIFLKYLYYTISQYLPTGDIQRYLYSDTYTAINLINLLLLAPILEELFFRGILFSSLKEKKLFYAAFVSAIAFSLFHLNFAISPLIFYFIFGIIFAYLYRKLGLFCCVLSHSLYIYGCLFLPRILK